MMRSEQFWHGGVGRSRHELGGKCAGQHEWLLGPGTSLASLCGSALGGSPIGSAEEGGAGQASGVVLFRDGSNRRLTLLNPRRNPMKLHMVVMMLAWSMFSIVAVPAASWAQCAGDCTTVSPVSNVPVNIDDSHAIHIEVDGSQGYRFWATGASGHAPDGCGRYTDVLAASPYLNAYLFSIPIDGQPVDLPAGVSGTRTLSLFFVEFGDGYLGDNWGSTQVLYQPLAGGQIQSVVVSPVSNIAFNCGGSNAAIHNMRLDYDYDICATGESHYASAYGLYGEAFLCVQRGCFSLLKAIPVDTGASIHLVAPGGTSVNPGYLWFPEFGSGVLDDNWGSTNVCFDGAPPTTPTTETTWGALKNRFR